MSFVLPLHIAGQFFYWLTSAPVLSSNTKAKARFSCIASLCVSYPTCAHEGVARFHNEAPIKTISPVLVGVFSLVAPARTIGT